MNYRPRMRIKSITLITLLAALLAALPVTAEAKCYRCSHRSASAKHSFTQRHPCPTTGRTRGRCPGYVVDHIRALKHGGADAPYNMQWQSKAAAKLKDRTE